MSQKKTISANLAMKGLAVVLLYVLLGDPFVYVTMWERRMWYVIVLGVVVVPLLLLWCAEVLVWRIRIGASTIEIRSLRGIITRQISDVSQVERLSGHIHVAFEDGSQRRIPAIIGDLDSLFREIRSRRDSV